MVVEPVPGLAWSLEGVLGLSCCLIDEAVPDTNTGEEKTPVFGNRFDLQPQRCHVDGQSMCSGVRIRAQELFEEVLARENLPAMSSEARNDSRGQFIFLPALLSRRPEKALLKEFEKRNMRRMKAVTGMVATCAAFALPLPYTAISIGSERDYKPDT